MRFSILLLFAAATLSVLNAETPLDESNSWAFELPDDAFSQEALLDLRELNEERSGQSGFIRLSEDRNGFVLGNGEPVRFWIVGTDAHRFSPEDMDRHARWLAKLGVNMVRLHVTVCDNQEGAKITDVNEKLIDGVYRFIRSAKENGIYVMISPFYAHFDAPVSWDLPGGKVDMEGLIFIDPKLQQAYQHWTKELYCGTNPYTGLAIRDDPTVAILQVHNEDSLFFWTAQRLPEHHRKILAKHFGKFLAKKYGSVSSAIAAWGDGFKGNDPLDDFANEQVACLRVYDLTVDGSGAYQRRQNDTAEFLAKFQREFYDRMGRYLRDDLHCRQLLNASNWRTANDEKLKALERYTYHALEIDSENEYVGSDYQHQGNNANYRIDPGHHLVNESVLGKPFEMCTNWRQHVGHPFIVTETAWKNPNRYQSEGPFLVAAYQSLTGVDGVAWFSCQTPRYETDPLKPFWRIGDQFSTHKWNHCYPGMMAGFPANAWIYRKAYLQEAPPVVLDLRSPESLFRRETPMITDNETYGDQRSLDDLRPEWKAAPGEINRAAFLVGPVTTKTSNQKEPGFAKDLSPYFDSASGTIRSATGELLWDYHRQICRMDSPKAVGITGFLREAGGRFEFSKVLVESENDYATVNVISLDDQPLSESGQTLVQVVTVNRLSGFETQSASFQVGRGDGAYRVEGEQIVRIGTPPFRIAHTRVAITIDNPRLNEAVVLDINGYPVSKHRIQGRFEMPVDAIYVIFQEAS